MKKVIVLLITVMVLAGCTEIQKIPQTEYERMVKFAERQAIEIAIIEQSVRLQQLKMAIKKAEMKPAPVNTEIPKEVSNVNENPDSE